MREVKRLRWTTGDNVQDDLMLRQNLLLDGHLKDNYLWEQCSREGGGYPNY